MCGIYFSYSGESALEPSTELVEHLRRRGPDHFSRVPVRHPSGSLEFLASVLSLRGADLTKQPLQDPSSSSILCWNGEAWRIHDKPIEGNDAETVFQTLLQAGESDNTAAALQDQRDIDNSVVQALSHISGPYAFIFYHAKSGKIFYGRDFLGRRSLLRSKGKDGSIALSSVYGGPSSKGCTEIEADGIYVMHLPNVSDKEPKIVERHIAWPDLSGKWETLKYPKSVPLPSGPKIPGLNLSSLAVNALHQNLRRSLNVRITDIPSPPSHTKEPAKIALLFSGGLDCTLLARTMHDILPKELDIDLLNVAFENPRVLKAANAGKFAAATPYSECPDRVTGLSSHAELQQVCPGRIWRFVSVDVPYAETILHRPQITTLLHPHNTEMDLSIACALYFAARGRGTACDISGSSTSYTTPARVLLSGLGADELFAGYTRHATSFTRRGYQGLSDELELDYQRLGKRNLGRDDRVISHWGREVRYPYLDEDFLRWALQLPLWQKCGFEQPSGSALLASQEDDGPFLEPSKKLLRLLTWKLGMELAAKEKKRAIQFGARTAKMEAGRTKGTKVLS
ncbi:MAG: hypothetical protein LQ343_002121 [Gyalolechia ehrenbergii]|nr:MAG: hypothetical protein LQ343_002121 [Gyalolechia ehrenbergii]